MAKIHKIVIYGQLPDYNLAIEKAKGDRFGKMYRIWKQETDEKIAWTAREQLRHLPGEKIIVTTTINGKKVKQEKKVLITANCAMIIRWYSRNRKKDQDNIEHAKKYILDGLQWGAIIPRDSWKHVGGNTLHEHYIDEDEPRVEVYLLEDTTLTYPVDQLLREQEPAKFFTNTNYPLR